MQKKIYMKSNIVAHLLLLSILLVILFCSCGGSGKYEDLSHKTDIMLIAEKDSIKIYYIYFNGRNIYFTNKGGIMTP